MGISRAHHRARPTRAPPPRRLSPLAPRARHFSQPKSTPVARARRRRRRRAPPRARAPKMPTFLRDSRHFATPTVDEFAAATPRRRARTTMPPSRCENPACLREVRARARRERRNCVRASGLGCVAAFRVSRLTRAVMCVDARAQDTPMWRKGWVDDESSTGALVDLCNACGACCFCLLGARARRLDVVVRRRGTS